MTPEQVEIDRAKALLATFSDPQLDNIRALLVRVAQDAYTRGFIDGGAQLVAELNEPRTTVH